MLEFGPPPGSELVGAGATQLATDIDTSGSTHSQMFDNWSTGYDESSASGFEPLGPRRHGGEGGKDTERQSEHYEH